MIFRFSKQKDQRKVKGKYKIPPRIAIEGRQKGVKGEEPKRN